MLTDMLADFLNSSIAKNRIKFATETCEPVKKRPQVFFGQSLLFVSYTNAVYFLVIKIKIT